MPETRVTITVANKNTDTLKHNTDLGSVFTDVYDQKNYASLAECYPDSTL